MNHKPLVHWHHRNTPRPSALCGKRTLCSVFHNTKRLPPIHVNSNVPIDYQTLDEKRRSIAAMYQPPLKLNALDRLLASRNPRQFPETQPMACSKVLGKFRFWRHRHSGKEEINEFSGGNSNQGLFKYFWIVSLFLNDPLGSLKLQVFHVMNLFYSLNSINQQKTILSNSKKKTSNS